MIDLVYHIAMNYILFLPKRKPLGAVRPGAQDILSWSHRDAIHITIGHPFG